MNLNLLQNMDIVEAFKMQVYMFHSHHTWKESSEPAQITSPLLSAVNEANWVGSGVVKVRKFLYLTKSHARTVPSNDALSTALFPGRKCTAVMEFVCSAKVTKQKPEDAFHTCHTCTTIYLGWATRDGHQCFSIIYNDQDITYCSLLRLKQKLMHTLNVW